MPIRLFKHYVHVSVLLLALVEAALFGLSVYAGVWLRFFSEAHQITTSIGAILPRAIGFSFIMMLSMVSMGLYHARLRPRTLGVVLRVAVAFALGSTALALLFYVLPSLYLGRGALALAILISFVAITVIRVVYLRSGDASAFRRRVLVYGAGQRAASLTRLRRRSDTRGFNIIGFIDGGGGARVVDDERLLKLDRPLAEFARHHEIDEIVVALDDRRRGLPVRDLLDAKLGGIEIVDVITFFERETGKVRLDMLYPSWIIFSEGFSRNQLSRVLKRVFDIVCSLVLLLFAWPLMLLAAIAILLETGPPVLYRQQRVGYEGDLFDVLKFRSMRVDAEEETGAQWASENDDRVTRVGRILRKYRIDELPQLINVLRGDMSFVGPRPERPEFVSQLSQTIPYYRERHCAKPGITGWAQLCYPYGSSDDDAAEKLQYDLFYVKNYSLLFDVLILLQTAEVVLMGKGAR